MVRKKKKKLFQDLKINIPDIQYKKLDIHTGFTSEYSNFNNEIQHSFKIPDKESIMKNKLTRIIHPSKQQKKILLKLIDIYRLVFNKTNKYLKNIKILPTFYDLRKILKSKMNFKQIPSHTIDYAIKDCLANYKTCHENLKNGLITDFNIRYKKKYKNNLYITFEPNCLSVDSNLCKTILGIWQNKNDFVDVKNTFKIAYNKITGLFWLSAPGDFQTYYSSKQDANLESLKHQDSKKRDEICSIDLGEKNFAYCFTSTGTKRYGIMIRDEILKKVDKYEKLCSKQGQNKDNLEIQEKCSRRKRLINMKIRNQIKDFHNKVALDIVRNYKVIICGKISTRSIVRQKMSPNVKKMIMKLSFYKFMQHLEFKAKEYNCHFRLVSEYMTSKTCHNCDKVKLDLKNDNVFNCNHCKKLIERDLNGAVNILRRSLI
jgi:putative transposase